MGYAMQYTRTSFATIATLFALAAPVATADAAPDGWTIVDLGSAHNIGSMALNDHGWVVMGNKILSPSASGYTTTELLSTAGTANNFSLRDINNANVVLGNDGSAGSWQAFVWQAGVRTSLPQRLDYTGHFQSQARGINDNGQVVGNTGDYAAIWSPNGTGGYNVTTLGWYWSNNSVGSGAGVSINGAGAGLMATVYNQYRPGYTTGLGNGITILGDGLIDSPAGEAINDRYAVAGTGTYNCGGYSCNMPFIWTSGDNVEALPLTPAQPGWAYNGKAHALNERNDVVGMGWYGSYDGRAVLWSASSAGWQEVDLNSVLPAGSNFWKLTEAMDINESGQILGYGAVNGDWQPHAFLLTPAVPEPQSWIMLLSGLVALRWKARRRLAVACSGQS